MEEQRPTVAPAQPGLRWFSRDHRAVARLLRKDMLLPWQRIVGAGGEIKLRGDAAAEQRLRLSMEGVTFRGKRVNMQIHEHMLRSWETSESGQSII